jgi:hypothetical protein
LVTLCVVFDVRLWELVLPFEDQVVAFSDDSLASDGWKVDQTHFLNAGEFGEAISGIPADYLLDPEKMESVRRTFNEGGVSVAQVLDRQRDLRDLIAQLVDQTTTIAPDSIGQDQPQQKAESDDS